MYDYAHGYILTCHFDCDKASEHFGGLLLQFIGNLASTADITKLPAMLNKACIAHGGALTSLYEYIPRMRKSN